MPRTTKKKEAGAVADKSLEQLILDKTRGKYEIVSLASIWALVLRRQEECRHLSQPEVLDMALQDLLSGQVTEEEVLAHAKEAAASLAAAPAANGKDKEKK